MNFRNSRTSMNKVLRTRWQWISWTWLHVFCRMNLSKMWMSEKHKGLKGSETTCLFVKIYSHGYWSDIYDCGLVGGVSHWSNVADIIGACQSGYFGGRAYLGQGDTRSQIEPWLCAETSFCRGESLTGLATFYPTFLCSADQAEPGAPGGESGWIIRWWTGGLVAGSLWPLPGSSQPPNH